MACHHAFGGRTDGETPRPDGSHQVLAFVKRNDWPESIDDIPEPHEFTVHPSRGPDSASIRSKHHDPARPDSPMREAVIDVTADAAVSVPVPVEWLCIMACGWLWRDFLAGIAGVLAVARRGYGLIRDAGEFPPGMSPDRKPAKRLRWRIESAGDQRADPRIWRPGSRHRAAVLPVVSGQNCDLGDYHGFMRHFPALPHVTAEV